MIKFKLLIIDDDGDSRKVMRSTLQAEGFGVIEASSGSEGIASALESKPDLILLDVSMPGMDGLAVCRSLRGGAKTAAIPIIMMSAVYTEEENQIQGIEQGADDYLPKPFSRGLLAAKVNAVLRRFHPPKELLQQLKTTGLVLDAQARTATLRGSKIHLTRKEFDLLSTLIRQPGKVLSIPYLLETVWGYDPAEYNDPHTVGVHISSLRKKLGETLGEKLVSVPGLGYRFET